MDAARAVCWLPGQLLVYREAGAAILLPASFGRFGAEGLFLAVADDANAAGCNTGRHKRGLRGIGTILPEADVVFV